MKISKNELIEISACKEGLERFIKQTGGVETPVEVVSLVGGENTYGDLLWLAGKTLDRSKIVRFACDCALLNIEKIKPYTDKYDLIVNFLNDPGDTAAARAAARTADAADTAAGYAYTYAAYAAIYVTTHDDINSAARAAGYAARAAARATGSENEVNELVRKLFR